MSDDFKPVNLLNKSEIRFTAHTQEQLESALKRKYTIVSDPELKQSGVDETAVFRKKPQLTGGPRKESNEG